MSKVRREKLLKLWHHDHQTHHEALVINPGMQREMILVHILSGEFLTLKRAHPWGEQRRYIGNLFSKMRRQKIV
jgi:hypothetical protein